MKQRVIYDTSVLVPALVAPHPQHAAARGCLAKAHATRHKMLVCSHTLAECYSVLTSLPVRPRIPPGTALHLIEESVRRAATVVDLNADDYGEVLAGLAKLGLPGGIVYDALVLQAARKSRATVLVTLNPSDFVRLLPPSSVAIKTPDAV